MRSGLFSTAAKWGLGTWLILGVFIFTPYLDTILTWEFSRRRHSHSGFDFLFVFLVVMIAYGVSRWRLQTGKAPDAVVSGKAFDGDALTIALWISTVIWMGIVTIVQGS